MADTVLTDLKIHDFDSLEQMSQYESEIGENDLVFTPDLSCRLPLLTPMWFDHIANDESWLRADTFSWHSGDKYKTAYNHLTNDMRTVYAWVDRAGSYGFNIYTESATPSVSDNIYDENGSVIGSCSSFNSGSLGWTGSDGTTYSAWLRSVSDDLPSARTETIGNITITYYLAQDGHKICLPDQESNIVALYESTGVAWYYLLDQTNQQFKLPRAKHNKYANTLEVVGTGNNMVFTDGQSDCVMNPYFGSSSNGVFMDKAETHIGVPAGTAMGDATRITEHVAVGLSTDGAKSGVIANQAQDTDQYKYLYFYVGNFEQDAVEQTAGLNAELFNNKADRNLLNTTDNVDIVIESQLPTADNGYTWYRKYKSGWVEQGGLESVTGHASSTTSNITLPIPMTDTNYTAYATINHSGETVGVACQVNKTSATNISLRIAYKENLTRNISWMVVGPAA